MVKKNTVMRWYVASSTGFGWLGSIFGSEIQKIRKRVTRLKYIGKTIFVMNKKAVCKCQWQQRIIF